MKILLTNDDGIYAPGIYAIYKELIKFADVTVVAPDSEQSSVGHGITLNNPLFVRKVSRKDKFFGYAVSGKPADCVKLGIEVILKKQKPDLVVSGINFGNNDGCSIFYSGTVAGAREGALMGVDSLALSLDCWENPDFTESAKVGAKLTKLVAKNKLPKGTFLNVNIPQGKIKGILPTRQGTEPIHGQFEKRRSPHEREYYWMSGKNPTHVNDNSIDTYALRNGYVTVTGVHCSLTDEHFLSKLQEWKF
ncbi:MAG: 5'/3'-nucleotidase SurE [Candidatus Omnitrophica bacterium]|nr:5'/3'-nucleotidase SurE [Candidatus Omnitrophota bacterium]